MKRFKEFIVLLLCAIAFYIIAGIGTNAAVGKPICNMLVGNILVFVCIAYLGLVIYANARTIKHDEKEVVVKERNFVMYDLKN